MSKESKSKPRKKFLLDSSDTSEFQIGERDDGRLEVDLTGSVAVEFFKTKKVLERTSGQKFTNEQFLAKMIREMVDYLRSCH